MEDKLRRVETRRKRRSSRVVASGRRSERISGLRKSQQPGRGSLEGEADRGGREKNATTQSRSGGVRKGGKRPRGCISKGTKKEVREG